MTEPPADAPETFADAALRPELKAALAALGFTHPTPVQTACLAAGLGRDLLVQARTGSGKTLAFGLPLLDAFDGAVHGPQALVIAPTRELALQIAKALAPLARALDVRCIALTGGADMNAQLQGLAVPRPQLVIGTPGRVLDHLQRESLDPSALRAVVLDEGDHLLDLGFKDELDAILAATPPERRTLMFSATMPPEVEALARRNTKDPRKVVIDAASVAHADIEHVAYGVPDQGKPEALANLLLYERPERTVVFCATREQARELSERLPLLGIPAALISGELQQRARNRALDAFREGRCHVLVATDVAARGIDVPATSHVIHFSLADTHETYIHRSGRTGRAGRKGVALSLVSQRERTGFGFMTKRARVKIDWRDLPGPGEIRRRRVELLAERLLGEGVIERTPEALESARRLVDATPHSDGPVGLVARLLDAAADLEGEPGYDLGPAFAAERARFARRERQAGPGRPGRFERKGPPRRGRFEQDDRPRPPRGRGRGDGRGRPSRGPAPPGSAPPATSPAGRAGPSGAARAAPAARSRRRTAGAPAAPAARSRRRSARAARSAPVPATSRGSVIAAAEAR
ncbi:MAG: DEAD/DEAH box helicase [Planctomycetes bacterium]|nr:DEAD/DEAH box helicase [Planctomycetota bacterium]